MKDKEIYFIECKIEKGKLSEIQKYRIDELINKGFRVAVSYGNEINEIYKEKIKQLKNN